MSSTTGQRGNPSDRVRQHAETRALNEAKRVPWRVLANAAEEYTEWQVFALWLRAVLDVCEGLPAEVGTELATRSPDLFSRIASAVGNVTLSRGSVAWEIVIDWVESNAFVRAKRERWLNAIRYFSSRSLPSMKAWSHWEDIDREWREKKPETLPTYEVWVNAASAVGRLSNPESDAQKVLDSIRLVPEGQWQQMFDAFKELTTESLWIEILLGAGKTGAELIAEELAVRYPHFDTCSIQNRPVAISSFAEWVLAHEPPFANAQQFLFALSYQTKRHPAYYARRSYAAHCRSLWSGGNFDRLPSFADWRTAADAYFES